MSDPVYTVAEKGILTRVVNSREKMVNGDVRAIRLMIRREHVMRAGPGMRSGTITLGEAYAYGLSTFYTTYAGGKYHLAANCNCLGS